MIGASGPPRMERHGREPRIVRILDDRRPTLATDRAQPERAVSQVSGEDAPTTRGPKAAAADRKSVSTDGRQWLWRGSWTRLTR